jgi:biopolymer transport protein ExbD
MTPMIDVVFQLLIFFCLTFKVIAPEGDFTVKMPRPGNPPKPDDRPDQPLDVRLVANASGQLAQVFVGERGIPVDAADASSVRAAMAVLRQEAIFYVGEPGPDAKREGEVVIDADPQLHYRFIIDAVTHVSGYKQGEAIVKLLEKVRFKPPKKG